jgi:hypothetical protein
MASSVLPLRLPFYNHNSSNANYSRFFLKKRGRKKGKEEQMKKEKTRAMVAATAVLGATKSSACR